MKINKLHLYILIPIIASILAVYAEYSGFDVWMGSNFYDAKSHSWPYKELFLTSTVFHEGGRSFVVAIAIINLIAIIASYFIKSISPYRKYLIFTFIAAISGPLVVSILKKITHIYVPWELSLFDGDKPYIRLFSSVASDAPVGNGFPGGHSSGGFAFISIYFMLLVSRNRYRHYGLFIPLALGVIFSITQEIRGAHFLSHDLFSFAICWSLSLAWFLVFFPNHFAEAYQPAVPERNNSAR